MEIIVDRRVMTVLMSHLLREGKRSVTSLFFRKENSDSSRVLTPWQNIWSSNCHELNPKKYRYYNMNCKLGERIELINNMDRLWTPTVNTKPKKLVLSTAGESHVSSMDMFNSARADMQIQINLKINGNPTWNPCSNFLQEAVVTCNIRFGIERQTKQY